MSIDKFLEQWHSPSATMEVQTSGSTGKPKVMHVEKARMLASAKMTCDFLGLQAGDCALLCMPLDYIAGKMMVVRSIERGMNLLCVEPSGHPFHNGEWRMENGEPMEQREQTSSLDLPSRDRGRRSQWRMMRLSESKACLHALPSVSIIGEANGEWRMDNRAAHCLPQSSQSSQPSQFSQLSQSSQLSQFSQFSQLSQQRNHETTKPRISLAAMVPLQAWNTLQVAEEREALCRMVRHLIIGGGAISPELERELSTLPLQVWSSYGMTETLSHIALRRVGESYYSPLPGISLQQDSEGRLIIDAPALCTERLHTNDIVELLADGRFRVLGRWDNVVCSGGIKIQIEEVEAWLHSQGITDVAVTWVEDPGLGQALVYLTTAETEALNSLHPDNRYWRPRHIVRVPLLPLTPTGKPDRAAARDLATRHLS